MKTPIPKIAIVGRTNVGKSTLFNRLAEKQKALVSDIPGTTRDRNEADCLWRGQIIRLVDTGGLDVSAKDELERNTILQAEKAIEQADVILFVVDLKQDPLPQEHQVAEKLNAAKKPVIVVGNKAETPAQIRSASDKQWRLKGLPAPVPVSSLRGSGLGDLLDIVYEKLDKIGKPPVDITEVTATRVAVIGKPNVGKSSLLNAFLKEERFITSDIAHTTREPNDTLIEIDGKSYILIDTAGIRKIAKVKKNKGLEAAGVRRTLGILKKSDVALFVLDSSRPLTSQDKVLAGLLAESNVGVIFVANKWDLVEDKTTNTMNEYKRYIQSSIPFVAWAPMIFVSALTKQRVPKIFPIIDKVQQARYMEIPQETLDDFLKRAMKKHLPSKGKGSKSPTLIGIRQTGIAPPKFIVTVKAKRTDVLNPSYLRFLENELHKEFELEGTPTIFRVRTPKARG